MRDIRETSRRQLTVINNPKNEATKPIIDDPKYVKSLKYKTLGASELWKTKKKADAKKRCKLFQKRLDKHKHDRK